MTLAKKHLEESDSNENKKEQVYIEREKKISKENIDDSEQRASILNPNLRVAFVGFEEFKAIQKINFPESRLKRFYAIYFSNFIKEKFLQFIEQNKNLMVYGDLLNIEQRHMNRLS